MSRHKGEWDLFHKYRKLVRQGDAKTLACPRCDNEWVLAMGQDDTPALRCYHCGTLTRPGSVLYDAVSKVVNQHYPEESND